MVQVTDIESGASSSSRNSAKSDNVVINDISNYKRRNPCNHNGHHHQQIVQLKE